MFPGITINNHVSIASEMMGMRLKLNKDNYDLLKTLCYEEWQKCKADVEALAGKSLNVGSPVAVATLLYKDLQLKPKFKRGKQTVTTDENALRELRVQYPQHKVLLNALIKERHIKKKIESYIEIQFDEDQFLPYAANPAGTETNRWSFSKSPRNLGLNAQTLPKIMRIMGDAPEDRVFISPDLPQADARIVAWDAQCLSLIKLFLDPKVHFHLENCIRLMKLPKDVVYAPGWKDDDPRYVTCKAMGHAANYRMAARRLAMELGIDAKEAQRLLNVYLQQLYPEIERWHYTIKERINKTGGLTTPFGRHRVFYEAWAQLMLTGKIQNEAWNAACAHIPQSAVADIVNVGMEQAWKEKPNIRFHLHGHDSYLASVPVTELEECVLASLNALSVTLYIHDRPLTMVPEMQIGWNYGLMVPWKGKAITRDDWWEQVKGKLNAEKIRKDLYGYF